MSAFLTDLPSRSANALFKILIYVTAKSRGTNIAANRHALRAQNQSDNNQ
jgi:hypothetical protein